MTKRSIRKKRKGLKEWGQALLLAFVLALIVKGFVVQSFVVGSSKMEKTMLAGDYVMVYKVSLGARLPITLLSLPFIPSVYSSLLQLPYLRVPGVSKIKQNDLLVINYPAQLDPPIDKREALLKRCVALPGDTIKISNKKVYVNDELLPDQGKLQFNYRLVTNGEPLDQNFLDKYGINEGGQVSEIGIYDFPLTQENVALIKEESTIRYVRELKDFPGENTQYVFPIGYYYSYNKDYFGPLVVPYKGQVVSITSKTLERYKEIISEYEGNTLEIRSYKIFINGREASTYTIKENYYFVLDDNRDNAKDSRYWGFLPESHVIGKAAFIWFSYDKSKGKIRWKRVLKSVKNTAK